MGLTVVDAGVVIGFLDTSDAHHAAARGTFEAGQAAGDRIVLAASAYAEVLVGPARRDEAAVSTVQRFVERLPVEIMDIGADIALDAARLRAKHGPRLRLPDALVVATARVHNADRLVTTDHRWPNGRALGFAGTLQQL